MTTTREERAQRTVWSALLGTWGGVILLAGLGFLLAWMFVEPAPPKRVTIATGPETGAYFAFGRDYARVFADNGVELIVRPTHGSVENYELLLDAASGVDLAIVQGGTLPDRDVIAQRLEAICSVAPEPLWIFHRAELGELSRLDQLKNLRIAAGEEGSGTRMLVVRLLESAGVVAAATGSATLLPFDGEDAIAALKRSEVDVVTFVAAQRSTLPGQLLGVEGVRLMSLSNADGISRKYPYLTAVTLYAGSIDLARNLPAEDVRMVAPTAMIVARKGTHKGLILLAVRAADQAHSGATIFTKSREFPSEDYLELPISQEARHLLRSGPSFLMRTFPFWLASFMERMSIMLLPLVTLLIPLLRLAPPVYVWRTRARIYRWYRELRRIDNELQEAELGRRDIPGTCDKEHAALHTLEEEVEQVAVPLSYMAEYYGLRHDIELIRRKIDRLRQSGSTATPH